MKVLKFQKVGDARKLSERVRVQLEQAILGGRLQVTQQLPTEAELGESFGVSRTVVREALQRLEAQGLVESRIGSGSFVTPYGLNQVQTALERFAAMNPQREMFLNLLDLRRLIEAETAARLAANHTPESLMAVERTIEQMRVAGTDRESFAQADLEFHLTIARGAGNPFFAAILEPLKNITRAFGLATYENDALLERVREDHRQIHAAIATGDPTTARGRMCAHVDFSRAHYLRLLDQRQRPAGST